MFDRLFFHWRDRLVNHLWPFGGIMQSTKEAGHIVTNYGERLTTSPREILIEIQLRDPSLYRVRVFDVWASMLELLSLRVVLWIHWLDFKIRELQINVTKERSELPFTMNQWTVMLWRSQWVQWCYLQMKDFAQSKSARDLWKLRTFNDGLHSNRPPLSVQGWIG